MIISYSVMQDIMINKREFVLFALDVLSITTVGSPCWETDDECFQDNISRTSSLRKRYGQIKYRKAIDYLVSKNFMVAVGPGLFCINNYVFSHEDFYPSKIEVKGYIYHESIS